jgi:hypothetical protein
VEFLTMIEPELRGEVVFVAVEFYFVIVFVHMGRVSEGWRKSTFFYFFTIFFCHTQGSILWNLTS